MIAPGLLGLASGCVLQDQRNLPSSPSLPWTQFVPRSLERVQRKQGHEDQRQPKTEASHPGLIVPTMWSRKWKWKWKLLYRCISLVYNSKIPVISVANPIMQVKVCCPKQINTSRHKKPIKMSIAHPIFVSPPYSPVFVRTLSGFRPENAFGLCEPGISGLDFFRFVIVHIISCSTSTERVIVQIMPHVKRNWKP